MLNVNNVRQPTGNKSSSSTSSKEQSFKPGMDNFLVVETYLANREDVDHCELFECKVNRITPNVWTGSAFIYKFGI